MQACQYQDPRNRFRCSEPSNGDSAWCFWHDPDQPKTRHDLVDAVARRKNLTGAYLEGMDLSEIDLQNACMYGAVLRFANLEGANLNRIDLRYSDLSGTNLDRTELQDALLEGANLSGASLRKSILRYANLKAANLQGTNLVEADLLNAHLIQANLAGTNLWLAKGAMANFWKANLSHSNLEQTDLVGANLSSANFENASLREIKLDRATNLVDLRYNVKTKFSQIDTSAIDGGLFPALVRDIQDYQFLNEFHGKYPFLYWTWKLTSDCGRSLLRWVSLYAVMAAIFGTLRLLAPGAIVVEGVQTWGQPYYETLMHLLSIGWKGGTPATGWGQVLLLAETLFSYVLFGGLLALLFHKMARRS